MAKRLNDCSAEVIEENFLKEEIDPNEIHMNEKVVVANEIPPMQKIIFINQRDPGCALQFHYKSKTHPLKQYTLYHGFKHDLPIEVIEHLEGIRDGDPWACHSRQYARRSRPDGTTETYANNYVAYFQCKRVRA
jgi:hypothetical protein